MMSLTEVNPGSVVMKQYTFKLKAYNGLFTSMVITQVIAILFSLGGTHSTGSSSNNFSINISYYSANMIIIFTLIWAFIIAIIITGAEYKNNDFSFVTNRLTSNVSNMLFLLTASVVSGITAILAGYFINVLVILFMEVEIVVDPGADVLAVSIGLLAVILYLLLLSSIGYLFGTLIRLQKLFAVVLPALLVGSLIISANMRDEPTILKWVNFYIQESSFLLFTVKVLVTVAILFGGSIVISNRMEVRR